MHHRTRELRAAVARRDRSQGQLRAVTATVGAGGVVTAGAVAFILPGATHTAASAQTTHTPRSAPAVSSPAAVAGSSGTAQAGHARRHHHHHHRAGGTAAGSAGAASASSAPAPPSTAPAPVPSAAPSHGVSGGS